MAAVQDTHHTFAPHDETLVVVAGAAAALYLRIRRRRKNEQRRRQIARRFWVRSWLLRRPDYGFFEKLLH